SLWSRRAGTRHRSRQTRSRTSRYQGILEYMEGRRLLSGSAASHALERPDMAVVVADTHQDPGGGPAALQEGPSDQGGVSSAAKPGGATRGPGDSTPPARPGPGGGPASSPHPGGPPAGNPPPAGAKSANPHPDGTPGGNPAPGGAPAGDANPGGAPAG